MTSLVIFGAGKIAEVVHDLLSADGQYAIAGFACDRDFITTPDKLGLPVVAFDEVEKRFPPAEHAMLVAIGYHDRNMVRAERCRLARQKGYRLASWVSPRAHVPKTCTIGENCLVMDGASLQPHARLGDDVFVWHGAVVGHHAAIGDHGWLASNCTVSSTATVEPHCFLGVNAAVGHGITIGARSILGAGAVITRSTAPDGVYIAPDTERFRLDSARFMKISRMV
jgi:sugar O-acyltransferase (sialic acid O-acetyltransferase NeuD family)